MGCGVWGFLTPEDPSASGVGATYMLPKSIATSSMRPWQESWKSLRGPLRPSIAGWVKGPSAILSCLLRKAQNVGRTGCHFLLAFFSSRKFRRLGEWCGREVHKNGPTRQLIVAAWCLVSLAGSHTDVKAEG